PCERAVEHEQVEFVWRRTCHAARAELDGEAYESDVRGVERRGELLQELARTRRGRQHHRCVQKRAVHVAELRKAPECFRCYQRGNHNGVALWRRPTNQVKLEIKQAAGQELKSDLRNGCVAGCLERTTRCRSCRSRWQDDQSDA